MVEEEQEGSALKRKNKRDEGVGEKRAEKRRKWRIKKEEEEQ